MRSEVVVIGGGVIGASTAYYLAKRGKAVALVEREDLAAGASGACTSSIASSSKSPGIQLKISLAGATLYDELVQELPIEVEYRQCGLMRVAESEEELEGYAKFVRRQKAIGLDVTMLDGVEARRREPALAEHIVGASYSPIDRVVNPLFLTFSLAHAAKMLGTRIYTHTEVQTICIKNGRIASVTTNRGVIQTATVVNAAGVYAPMIGKLVGVDIPIKPIRGQILVTEAAPPLLHSVMCTVSYIRGKLKEFFAATSTNSEEETEFFAALAGLEQTASGNLIMGTTIEPVGYDRSTTLRGIRTVVRNAIRIVPALKRLQLIRSFAGLRPKTPDGLPIIGAVDDVEGFYTACGHGGDGIALAPITGKLIADLIIEGKATIPTESLNLSRFTSKRKHESVMRQNEKS